MTRRLYIYEHCPFCVKARMIFGLKGVPVELVWLLNDNEADPIRMIGRKLLPILEEDGRFMGESMDIVAHVDAMGEPVLTGETNPAIAAWISSVSGPLYRLMLPRVACAPFPEFETTGARAYFVRKKEASTGMFAPYLESGTEQLAELNNRLPSLVSLIRSPSAVNGILSTDDIHLFAALHSLSIIAGVVYPPEVETYRQTMSGLSNVPLMDAQAA
ncbi:glutaredoxin 2 [Acetobacter estunensis NRIC 0472]|uniref:Glutaredoxin 2 n=1 Tax=Acetobacter estunensis TaxID=104097 RepID=A0A967BAB5_9PROT|nr:glutaredoxin 2 [Acetobacter estunensis]NHO52667.1 glutaredoxin 2 [Acetobacter estunensis]GBQ22850.1 glutaredoxin 2 [Acetobacter estunensis NRIC 0472]